jgi:hypothetical protein
MITQRLRISVCMAAIRLLSPKSFAGLQIPMTMSCDRKRIGGEGRVRGFFFIAALLERNPHPASFSLEGRRDNYAPLQNSRLEFVLFLSYNRLT